jgi:predicted nicotinamide N-methyase
MVEAIITSPHLTSPRERGTPPRVVAGYPARVIPLQFGAVHVDLLVVSRLEDYVDAAAQLRDADAPEPPYWAHVWPGSRVLADLVATQLDCVGRRVIDIGCGVGLAGLVAAKRGAPVTMIDSARDALCFAHANAALNRCDVAVLQSHICADAVRGEFDYCLAADVTYDPALQTGVAKFLARHLAPGGRAWCAESVRTMDPGFAAACARHGLRTIERTVRVPDEGRAVAVRLTLTERT